ncbi:MAG: glycogen synthase [Steroidobacteraceae bacterium]
MSLRVALLASEATPLSKTGGLADVAGALAECVHAAGHDARLFTPGYAAIDRSRFAPQPVAGLQDLPLQIGPHRYVFSLSEVRLPGAGVPAYLIECPALYGRATLYTADADEHLRFLAFTRAALLACTRLGWAPHIVHCNDWHTAFAPLMLRTQFAHEPTFAEAHTVLTIHNIGYQGVFGAEDVDDLDLGDQTYLLHQDDLRAGHINPLRHGILYAEALTTVSPTHAREICTDEYGMGLQDSLRLRERDLTGILNGVDYSVWDPRCDPHLPRHFDAGHLDVKADLKRTFLTRMGLATPPAVPLAGIVSRLALQKGFDLMFDTLPSLLESRPFALVVLGTGEARYQQFFAALAERFPGRVVFQRGYDDALAHWIEAACDLFLMPSRYEPCGLNQMYSLRYGTVPVVRRTGGLADSVEHFDPGTGVGTGVVFNNFDAPALTWALNTALDWYAEPALWRRIVHNAMAQDFSWARQSEQYLSIYRRLAGQS